MSLWQCIVKSDVIDVNIAENVTVAMAVNDDNDVSMTTHCQKWLLLWECIVEDNIDVAKTT